MGTVSQADRKNEIQDSLRKAKSGEYTGPKAAGVNDLGTSSEFEQISAAWARGQNIDGSAYDPNATLGDAYQQNLKSLRALTDANRIDSTDALLRKGQAEGLRNLTTRGRQSTFLTGAMGDITSPQVGRQTLLGGPPSVSGLKKWGTP